MLTAPMTRADISRSAVSSWARLSCSGCPGAPLKFWVWGDPGTPGEGGQEESSLPALQTGGGEPRGYMVGQPLSPRDVLHTAPECESLGLGDPSTPIHRGRKESSGRLCSVPQMPQLKVTETIRPSFFLKTQSLPLIRLPPDGAPAPPPEIGGSAHLTSAWGPGPGRDEARILDRAFLVPPQAVDRPARDPEEAPCERGAGAQPGSRAKLDPHPRSPGCPRAVAMEQEAEVLFRRMQCPSPGLSETQRHLG